MSDRELMEGKEYPMEFKDGEFKMKFGCYCKNEYVFSIFMYDDGTLTLKIDRLGIEEKN